MRRLLLLFLLLCSPVAWAEVSVLTSIKPLQLIAAAVQDGVALPQVLLPAGASPHHFALRPSDIRRVQEAQLLYWIGPEMETFLPRVLRQRSQPTVAVKDLPAVQLRYFGETAAAAPEPVGHAHAHDHDHSPGTLDAHLWLSPVNAKLIAAKMAADLAVLDPANAARYQRNLQAFEQRVDALNMRLLSSLAGIQDKPYFVFHETYAYFEAAYGLTHAGVFSLSSEAQPGARRVAQMREELQLAGPTCVFSEPPLRPRLAQTLSAGLPVQLAELDALGSAIEVSAQGYEQLLQGLADAMLTCLRKVEQDGRTKAPTAGSVDA